MSAPSPYRVLIVDDDPEARAAYRAFFATQQEFMLVGEARDGADAIEAYAFLRPDVVLMDLQMSTLSGIDATRAICERHAGACIVAMTTFGTREYVVAALRAGAAGYLLKDAGRTALRNALLQALGGNMPLSAAVRRELVASLAEEPGEAEGQAHGLAPREVELLGWLARGLTNRQIATQMHVSEGTVKQYVARICDKLQVNSRTQVLVRSIQLGVVDPRKLPPIGGRAVGSGAAQQDPTQWSAARSQIPPTGGRPARR